MVSPQTENGFLRFATEIAKQLPRLNLPPYEWRVTWAVLLKTWGWRKKSDSVPVSQLVEMTGLRQPHVSRAKASLLKKRILFEKDGKIGFQKNYELWAVKGFIHTSLGMNGHTDSGMKSGEKYTNSGSTHTSLGMKSIPIPGNSIDTTDTINRYRLSADAIMGYWNSKENLKPVRSMPDSRKDKLKTRAAEPLFADNWRQIIDRISASDFCTGGGKKNWRADIDWLLANSTNYVKVLEGKYDNDTKTPPLERDAEGLTPRERFYKEKGLKP